MLDTGGESHYVHFTCSNANENKFPKEEVDFSVWGSVHRVLFERGLGPLQFAALNLF
jgi:hypothetical protein